MRILFLTQIIPYPPDAGPKVKTWHVLRFLVNRGHHVTLVSFVRPEEVPHLENIREHGIEVHPVPIRRSRIADGMYMAQSYLTGKPFLVLRDDNATMRRTVEELARNGGFDLIHADQLTMAQFALGEDRPGRPPVVFDAHNAVWTIVDRMRRNAPWFLRPVLAVEARRVKRYEGGLLDRVAGTLAVTEMDRTALLDAWRAERTAEEGLSPLVDVIPIAVDTDTNRPVQRAAGSKRIMTLGTLHYPPNADGIRWFAREVYPLIREMVPDASLTVVGKNPPPDFIQMAAEMPDIEVTGYVPDLQPYLEASGVLVVPVRAGGGMRVRILEAFAFGMPVVTTTVGLEGIEAAPGRDVLVEDTPRGFADAVAKVLSERAVGENLGKNGRELAETRYDWKIVLGRVEQVYRVITKH